MYYIKILTKYNEIELVLEQDMFYDDNFQQLLQQPYVSGVYLRWIDENEYEHNVQYSKIKKMERKRNDR